MITYNEGDPDDYNTEPSHPSDQEEEGLQPENKNNYKNNYKYNAQFSEILEEFSNTELGRKKNSENHSYIDRIGRHQRKARENRRYSQNLKIKIKDI